MAELTFNTTNIKRVPINRNNLFYSEESFLFEQEIGKNYIEQDMNQTAVLYSVKLSNTNVNSIYGETDEGKVQFDAPTEFHCVYKIEEPELKSYDSSKNLGTYMKPGKLELGVYQETLDELGIDIKKGDYIGIQVKENKMVFFGVIDPGLTNYDNAHTLFGVKPLFRSVIANYVDPSEFSE